MSVEDATCADDIYAAAGWPCRPRRTAERSSAPWPQPTVGCDLFVAKPAVTPHEGGDARLLVCGLQRWRIMASRPPWKRSNPKQRHTKLTAKSKRSARARARRAGRTYPSLVDNMNAAKRQNRGGGAKARKRTTKTTRKGTTTSRRKRSTTRARKRS